MNQQCKTWKERIQGMRVEIEIVSIRILFACSIWFVNVFVIIDIIWTSGTTLSSLLLLSERKRSVFEAENRNGCLFELEKRHLYRSYLGTGSSFLIFCRVVCLHNWEQRGNNASGGDRIVKRVERERERERWGGGGGTTCKMKTAEEEEL